MGREIKVKLNGFSGEYSEDSMYLERYFPIKVLKDNFNVKFVDDVNEAEIICENCSRGSDYNFLHEKEKKVILFSAEDLFKKRDLFNLIESLLHKLGFKGKKWKIMDKIDDIIPHFVSGFPLFYFLPRYLKFIKSISLGEVKNAYAVIQNDLKGKNIFIVPCFFHTFYVQKNKLIKKKVKDIKNKKKFCAFIVTSNSSRERVKFFKKLSKYKKVDSYGKVQNNMGENIFDTHWVNNFEILKQYKFVISFENNFTKEYMTEKLPNAMLGDTIPIYRGAPNIGEYFNTKSFINYDDYGSYDKMIKKIIELDKSDEKYLKMANEPWFVDNKIPKILGKKEKELIEFYEKIFSTIK
ncbi:hypothetical protein HOD29_03025 [archaeon]|jgi:hypothetical protein|nr:hypothetical protein [archaeon]